MKKINKFVSPVFIIGLLIFLGSFVIAAVGGGVGPCGPTNMWGKVCFFTFPLGLIGMALGAVLSVIKTILYFRALSNKKHGAPD